MVILPLALDALRDPEKWDKEWDTIIERQFLSSQAPDFCFESMLTEHQYGPAGVDQALASYQGQLASTCAVQRNLTEDALGYFISRNLEAKWMRAGGDVRGEHILRGMATVCNKARNLNQARCYTPELRLARLRLDGKVFLDLLKSAMLDDASFIPATPKYISHRHWDRFEAAQGPRNDTDAKKMALAEVLLLRTKLICHVLQFTLRSFFGLELPEFCVVKEHKSIQGRKTHPLAPLHEANLEAALGPEAARAYMKGDKQGAKARISQRVAHCSYLGCHNSEPTDGSVKFSRCKQCFDLMQRQVLYCSGKCQKADWKLRHKAVCGKPMDFDAVSVPVVHPTSVRDADTRIGLPTNGFRRPPGLVLQVTQLNKSPTVDYYLYRDGNEQALDFGQGTYEQDLFRAHREEAMTSGNRGCVALMAHYMCWMIAGETPERAQGITQNMIVAQLAREYDFPSLRGEVLRMQEIQNRDPLRRPPLHRDTSPYRWRRAIEGTNAFERVVTLD
ncbi:hypothetical protein DFH07DRAFT_372919 [Mycena maculata]|uniref:MYND-type domain-containing protein n=1 Tax=Mycena maculata TaxID=230809 RepID=A0AAD7NK39_9AGAR|nr:hypothetical protein DFH07DRAFT_372919 [Mycena maculata]